MKLLTTMFLYSLLTIAIITQATSHVVVQQYLMFFFVLGGFVITANEIIKNENLKGEK